MRLEAYAGVLASKATHNTSHREELTMVTSANRGPESEDIAPQKIIEHTTTSVGLNAKRTVEAGEDPKRQQAIRDHNRIGYEDRENLGDPLPSTPKNDPSLRDSQQS
jgi:hypothetical protein